MLNKISKIGMALLLSISSLGLINNNVQGAETLTPDEEMELAILFEEHLYADENHYLHISNKDELIDKLNNSNSEIPITFVEDLVNDCNSKLSGEQGTEIQQEIINSINNFENEMNEYLNNNNDGIQAQSAQTVCSAAMTGVGISNAAIITAGGIALGAAGPAGWAALATSAMWGAGSVAACN